MPDCLREVAGMNIPGCSPFEAKLQAMGRRQQTLPRP